LPIRFVLKYIKYHGGWFSLSGKHKLSPMPSIFVLGATGYIGGAVLFTLLQEIPELKATALVRGEAQIATLSSTSADSGFKDDIGYSHAQNTAYLASKEPIRIPQS
jgi:hypothetical protein